MPDIRTTGHRMVHSQPARVIRSFKGPVLWMLMFASGFGWSVGASEAQSVILMPSGGDSGMVIGNAATETGGGDAPEFALEDLVALGEFGDWAVLRGSDYCIATSPASGDESTHVFLLRDSSSEQVFLGVSNPGLAVTPGLVKDASMAVIFDNGDQYAGRSGLRFQRTDSALPIIQAMIFSRLKQDGDGPVVCESLADCAGISGRRILHGLRGSDDVTGFLRSFQSAASFTLRVSVPATGDDGEGPVEAGRVIVAQADVSLKGSGRALSAVNACAKGG